jgi:hypothetical protein
MSIQPRPVMPENLSCVKTTDQFCLVSRYQSRPASQIVKLQSYMPSRPYVWEMTYSEAHSDIRIVRVTARSEGMLRPSIRGAGADRSAPRVDAWRYPVLPPTGRATCLTPNMRL